MNERKLIRKNEWTKDQNAILISLASNVWQSKKDLLKAITTKIPKVSATSALRHALNNQRLKFEYGISTAAKAEAINLLRQNFDSATVRDQIHLNYGTLKSVRYYNQLRFILNRGSYVIKWNNKTKKTYLVHRNNMAKAIAKTNNTSVQAATKSLVNKLVSHPVTIIVSENEVKDLFVTDHNRLTKITRINEVTTALGLEFGSLISLIDPEDLSTKTPTYILNKIFKNVGLDTDARKYFN